MEKQRITYIPQGGVCSKMMIVDIADGKIENAQVIGGCDGNRQGMCALLKVCRWKKQSVGLKALTAMAEALLVPTRWLKP